MIAVTAISESALRRELFEVLSTAGWTILEAQDGDEALRLCGSTEADVLLIDEAGAISTLDRLNTGAERLPVGVVSALEHGAADVLRIPVDPADAIARATAAARTKALVKQLTSENSRMEDLVLFDDLTGLRNRRAILLELETMVATSRRHHRPLSALMIDVDNFKDINDTHGHRTGDAVLREVAARIGDRLRGADVAGRLGGDEVMVLLPETESPGAAILADSIRVAISDRPVSTPSGPIDVTVSLGAAAWEGESSEHLLDRADKALYAAKAGGRDRSVAL